MGKNVPATTMTPTRFIERILRFKGCSPCSEVFGMLCLERLRERKPNMRRTSSTFWQLMLVACVAASKYCDDEGYSDAECARRGGIQIL
mmetsp:Transcript_3841/g.9672  ORF Transcript_3841/g.9672 Transcript_3841/m.9672 type:complete len:89 (+) Transcript_3841:100-366(+)